MKKIYIIICVILVILIFYLLYIKDNKIKVELDKCVDGDTAWFKINDNIKKYRFLSIDTMELDTEFGKTTSYYVCELLKNAENIEIEYSEFGDRKDKYNRELVFVHIDNKLLQEKLIENGYAKLKYVYAKYEYLDKLIEIEKKAKNKKIGLWKNAKDINNKYNIIDNPEKNGCKFIGWEYNGKLYDMTNKLNKKYKLKSKFDC